MSLVAKIYPWQSRIRAVAIQAQLPSAGRKSNRRPENQPTGMRLLSAGNPYTGTGYQRAHARHMVLYDQSDTVLQTCWR